MRDAVAGEGQANGDKDMSRKKQNTVGTECTSLAAGYLRTPDFITI